MNFKQKLVYMALGCVFTLIGYTLATLNTNVTAQSDDTPSEATFDKITCQELLITDGEGDYRLYLRPGGLSMWVGAQTPIQISNINNQGIIQVTGKYGETRIADGLMKVKGPERTVSIRELGVQVSERDGKSGVTLTTWPSGGTMYVTDRNGTIVSRMGVQTTGGGLIQLHDQHEKSLIQLNFGDDGGHISFFNKGGENVLQAGVNDRGGGTINTKDKHGHLTGRLP